MARRVQNERRIKDGESKRGEDLDEEQGRGSFGDVGEPAFPSFFCGFHSFPWQFIQKGTAPSDVIPTTTFTDSILFLHEDPGEVCFCRRLQTFANFFSNFCGKLLNSVRK